MCSGVQKKSPHENAHTHMHIHQCTSQLSLEINYQLESIEDVFANVLT